MTIPQAFQLAVERHQAGRVADAEALCGQIVAVQPNHAGALHVLGVIAHQAGRHHGAVDLIRRSIVFHPNDPLAHSNLGESYRAIGRFDEAVAACRRALQLKPDYPEAHNNLGAALAAQGRLDEAIAAYRRASELNPDYPEALNNLGVALKDQGQLDEAVAAYRRALQLRADHPEVLNNLGNALKRRGELDEALTAYRRALQIKPDYAGAHSNLVYALHYHPGHDNRSIFEEHERWNRQFSEPRKPLLQPHANDPAADHGGKNGKNGKNGNHGVVLRHANDCSVDRLLRVGYVSPDFRDHAVGRYVLPLFQRHDRTRFEILCYSEVARPDWMTERLRALAGKWRHTLGVSDARMAEMIREDAVDILVDLSLHTAGNRLPMFAGQPAPVQVTWLGYPGSTGLPGIGYRLTDTHMEPPGEEPASRPEEPVRLPDCWCCYEPADESPEINALPALSEGRVTFGSLNNFTKVNEGVLALWARIMNVVQASRLLMLCPEGRTQERVRAFLGARGIATERVEFVGFAPRQEYLRQYQRIDLALDPFPCNGMTTTCDALWMGVPVLTLPGEMPVSRAGLSLLSTIGLGELAASSEEDYARMAVELAGDLPRVADLRATLRPRMLASPLMDAPRFARNVEAAYRTMWERWRAGAIAHP